MLPRSVSAFRKWRLGVVGCLLLAFFVEATGTAADSPADAITLNVDFSVPNGRIRALHGINKGPLAPGGIIDLTKEQAELEIPFTRLHDCGWPNPYVVDHHVVFPNPQADPSLPESYDFRLTDEYIAAVRKTGAEPIYRLGESIEHTSVKRYVHPPVDMEKWAAICLGIIRHYNEGWASGHHYGIRYWEIWNEPENRPVMWSGSDDDYLRLYRTAARAIKKDFPQLKVGGPALGSSGSFVNGEFQPTEFARNFVGMCRRENVALNFFSWHCYTDDPSELVRRSRAIRRFLDGKGFTDTESHLNEWNYLPGNTWKPIMRDAAPMDRQRAYADMAGPAGAAFAVTSLLELQDSPLEVANFFHGEIGGFGMFNEHGVPQKIWQGFRAFRDLLATPHRVETSGAVPGKLAICAGLSEDGREATIVVSNYGDPRAQMNLRWKGFGWLGDVTADIRSIDPLRDYASVSSGLVIGQEGMLQLPIKAPSITILRLRPVAGNRAKRRFDVAMPKSRLVFQRDQQGKATIPIKGMAAWPGAKVEARLTDVRTRNATPWTEIGTVQPDESYEGKLIGQAGWYSLEVSVRGEGESAIERVERVGIGEVFVVVGHSVAHGGSINLPGATDDRVCTIALPSGDPETMRRYKFSGDPQWLPGLVGQQFGSDVMPAPAGNGTYFWAAFGEEMTKAHDVPVLVLNAAFGGTSLEHWAKSARGESFEHPFVNSAVRMPYIRLEHALRRYCQTLGLRAILSDHGQNDWPERDEDKIFANYRTWIEHARREFGAESLAVVINRQSPPDGIGQIRRVQDRVIKEVPFCIAGPDYDTFSREDTTDKVHLSEAGAKKAARRWAEVFSPEVLGRLKPVPGR